MGKIKKTMGHYRLVYPMMLLKLLIFYWQTDRLDLMSVYEVPILSILFLFFIYEMFSLKEGKGWRYGFYIVYTVITLLMFADAAYSSYFGKYISVNQIYQLAGFGQIAGDGNVIGASVNPCCLLTLVDYPFVLYWYKIRKKEKKENKKPYVRTMRVVFFVVVFGSFIYYGFNPMNLRSVQQINHIEFFTYHTNDILVNVVGKMKRRSVDEEKIKKTMTRIVPKSSGQRYHGVAKGKNLILIQTESLNNFVVGKTYNGQEITPNMNRLLKKDTISFPYFYSTTGVGNTCDAEFSTLNSLYPNDERECYRMYVDNTYNGLPWMFREKGYDAMAFHGYIKTFWNRNEAYKNQGFSRYYSEEDFDITQVSGFGLTDKEMFRQSVEILKTKKQPFFAFMITLTNHIPYELSPSLATLSLKEEDENSTFGNYLQTVRYTDEAFGDLIHYLKKSGLYDNTVIAIYGDHQGMNMETPSVSSKMTKFLGKKYDYDEMLRVPFLIHIPGLGMARRENIVGGQVDIMPTIANLMDLDPGQPYVFGHDLLNTQEGFLAQISYVGKGSFLTGKDHLLFKIGKDATVENGRLLSLLDGSRRNLNKNLCQKYSDRALCLLETCKKVLDFNLIANYVTH
ncbi:MAG: LTA synthase family protein [Lachnospiraceae bacterium]|nr:LTA synthase family protein [Lachnospiraceae bacterium]